VSPADAAADRISYQRPSVVRTCGPRRSAYAILTDNSRCTPTIGILLCAGRNDKVVRHSLAATRGALSGSYNASRSRHHSISTVSRLIRMRLCRSRFR
jgi:hypothetical protein